MLLCDRDVLPEHARLIAPRPSAFRQISCSVRCAPSSSFLLLSVLRVLVPSRWYHRRGVHAAHLLCKHSIYLQYHPGAQAPVPAPGRSWSCVRRQCLQGQPWPHAGVVVSPAAAPVSSSARCCCGGTAACCYCWANCCFVIAGCVAATL